METTSAMCRCGHSRTAHEHYRRGADCGACGRETCAGFRLAAGDNVVHFRRQIVRGLRERPAPALPLTAVGGTAAPIVADDEPSAV